MNDPLWILIAVLMVLWMLGLFTAHAFGGLIHVLLVVAFVVLIVKLVRRV